MIKYIKKLFKIKTDILFVRIATIAAHIGVLYSLFNFTWPLFLSGILFAFIVSVFMDVGYHRFYSHRSFKATKLFEILTVIFTIPAAIGSPMAWAALHRYHHRHSDTEEDPHSPYNLSLKQMLSLDYDYSKFERTLFLTKDFLKEKWHRTLHVHYFDLVFLLYAITFLIDYRLFIIVCCYPAVYNYYTYMVTNYLEHINFPLSEQPYKSDDHSVNNVFLNWGTFGHTGLHNNHHAKPGSWRYDIGGSWWEFDSGRWVLLLMNKLGLVELKNPTL